MLRSFVRTQLLSGETQISGVLVQMLVEIDTQSAQFLLDLLDLLLQEIKSLQKRRFATLVLIYDSVK